MTEKDWIQRRQCIWCNRVFTNANLKTSNLDEHYNKRHGSMQSGNDFSTLKNKRAWFDSGGTLLKQAVVPMEKQLSIIAGMLQSYVLVWQEESLIQLLKNLWRHVNYVVNSYYLPSDKGYERILWKLRGYECVERLRTTALVLTTKVTHLRSLLFRQPCGVNCEVRWVYFGCCPKTQ